MINRVVFWFNNKTSRRKKSHIPIHCFDIPNNDFILELSKTHNFIVSIKIVIFNNCNWLDS